MTTCGMGFMGTKSTPERIKQLILYDYFLDHKKRTDYDAIRWHVLAGHLKPTTRGGTKIDTAPCRLKERIFFVELY